eukprot:75992-Alexandrium_andersonii.AAC.1
MLEQRLANCVASFARDLGADEEAPIASRMLAQPCSGMELPDSTCRPTLTTFSGEQLGPTAPAGA